MSLKGSKTEDNLKAAFAGESQANRRYLYFAQKADVEGYNDVSALFSVVSCFRLYFSLFYLLLDWFTPPTQTLLVDFSLFLSLSSSVLVLLSFSLFLSFFLSVISLALIIPSNSSTR